MATNCGCTLLPMRVLVRLEQLESSGSVPLEVSLELAEQAEADCLTVLHCETCRKSRLSLVNVTVLSACVVDWLQRSWQLDGCDDPDRVPVQVSLGDYDLEPVDAETLMHELMALRLSHFANVMASLKAATATLGSAPVDACLDVVQTKIQQLHDCTQRVKALSSASN